MSTTAKITVIAKKIAQGLPASKNAFSLNPAVDGAIWA